MIDSHTALSISSFGKKHKNVSPILNLYAKNTVGNIEEYSSVYVLCIVFFIAAPTIKQKCQIPLLSQ